MRRSYLGIAIVTLLAPAAALAASQGGMPKFSELDQDGNGELSKQEIQEAKAIDMEFAKKADFGKWKGDNETVSKFEYQTQVNRDQGS